MRSDHHLNLLSRRVQIFLVEFSSCMARWRCLFGWTPTWRCPSLLIPGTSPRRGRLSKPGRDCWMLIRSMRAGLSRPLPWWDTKIWAEIVLMSQECHPVKIENLRMLIFHFCCWRTSKLLRKRSAWHRRCPESLAHTTSLEIHSSSPL